MNNNVFLLFLVWFFFWGGGGVGEAYSAAGYLNEAVRWYKESLKSKPDHLPAHLTYAKHLSKMVNKVLVGLMSLVLMLVSFVEMIHEDGTSSYLLSWYHCVTSTNKPNTNLIQTNLQT